MSTAATRTRKKDKVRKVSDGVVHVMASFNNTIITITDRLGNTLSWSTAGACGFKGSRKSTPYAATLAAKKAAQAAQAFGLRNVQVVIRGPGAGREPSIRALGEFFIITELLDKTPVPHNGCRDSGERRV
jgi:small subunit ribosomal protein S11